MVVVGGVILTGSWIPQIIKVLKTRSSRDLSIPFLIAASSGTLLLVPYSILINDTFFILVNLFAGIFAAITLVVAVFYRMRSSSRWAS
jgi:MtN3 and saliva related transmembrane protein